MIQSSEMSRNMSKELSLRHTMEMCACCSIRSCTIEQIVKLWRNRISTEIREIESVFLLFKTNSGLPQKINFKIP